MLNCLSAHVHAGKQLRVGRFTTGGNCFTMPLNKPTNKPIAPPSGCASRGMPRSSEQGQPDTHFSHIGGCTMRRAYIYRAVVLRAEPV